MVIVGEGYRVKGPGRPAPMSALLIVVTASVHILAQVMDLLVPVEVPGNTPTETDCLRAPRRTQRDNIKSSGKN
jgi:hypothetical protein